jgi:MFS transporter, FHS family, glucose/mannose:H+ symporter
MFAMLRQPTVLLLAGVIALYVGGEIGINAWIVRYFDEELLKGNPLILHLGASHKQIATSFLLTLYWFSMTVGRVFTTLAGRVVPDTTLLRFVTLMSAVCAIATFAVGHILPAAIFLGLTGLFFSGIFPTTLAIGGNRYPESLGLVSGILIGFSGIGNVVLNSAIGEIAQRTGSIRAGLMFVAALLLGMAACAFGIKKMKYPVGHN